MKGENAREKFCQVSCPVSLERQNKGGDNLFGKTGIGGFWGDTFDHFFLSQTQRQSPTSLITHENLLPLLRINALPQHPNMLKNILVGCNFHFTSQMFLHLLVNFSNYSIQYLLVSFI